MKKHLKKIRDQGKKQVLSFFKNIKEKTHVSFPMTVTSVVFILIFLRIMHVGIWTYVFWVFVFTIGFLDVYFVSILKNILTNTKKYSFTKFMAHLSAFSFLTIFLFGLMYSFFSSPDNYLWNTLYEKVETGLESGIYFSGVTLLSIGYGDIIPYGFFRLLALVEGFIGSFVILSFFSIGISHIFWKVRHENDQRLWQRGFQEIKRDLTEEEREIEKIEREEKEIKERLER